MRKFILQLVVFSVFSSVVHAQKTDDLMDMLDKSTPAAQKKQYATATFKATRLIDGMTVENLGAGVLDCRIDHRFGQLSQGSSNFYGVDDATTLLDLDYGITKWLMVGLNHSVLNKEYGGFLKAKILRQQKDAMPFTLSYAFSTSEQTTPSPQLPVATDKWYMSNRLYYTNQILIGRKFSEAVSFQIVPTIVHYNIVDSNKTNNNTVALGLGGRVKLTKRMAITGEYYYRLTNTDMTYQGAKTYNSCSLGLEIETGGHVFQLMLTNSASITERMFIGQTTDSWGKGQLHIGFNISRVFTVVKPKGFKGSDAK